MIRNAQKGKPYGQQPSVDSDAIASWPHLVRLSSSKCEDFIVFSNDFF